MTTLSTLNDKDQELIAIGASIAAGCVPCAKYHFRAARIAGAQDAEIQQAVSDALCVRRSATEGMAELADSQLHRDAGAACCDDKLLLGELVSVAAAYAVNSVAELEKHIAAAHRQGATGEQVLASLKIACMVKDMAGNKVQAAATKALGGDETSNVKCGCQSESNPSEERIHDATTPVNERGCHATAN